MSIKPQSKGTVVYPYKNTNGHNYVIGKAYIVFRIDEDGTFTAKDPATGQEGNWIKWDDVTLTQPLGWLWLKNYLPPDIVNILELFDGIESIILKDDWKNRIIMEFPELYTYLQNLGKKVATGEVETNISENNSNRKEPSILPFPDESSGIFKPKKKKSEGDNESDLIGLEFKRFLSDLKNYPVYTVSIKNDDINDDNDDDDDDK